jgi:hypothetical protein
MKTFNLAAVLTGVLCLASSASAQETHSFIQGFGGLRVGTTTSTTDTAFGGILAGNLTPNIQVLGEAGRMSNVLPSRLGSLLSFSPVGLDVSAWYAEGGLRWTAGRSAMRPYVETSAGFARLSGQLNGLAPGTVGTIANIGLQFLERTDPIASVGGGVTLQGGPFFADVGYRYRRIFSDSWFNALTLGDTLHTSEVRLGFGLRF